MMAERPEPFRQALIELRTRLRDGRLAPGGRVTAREVADSLKLSATPVREALSRLAGEGVLEERRGAGYYVAELSGPDIAALYAISQRLLLLAEELARDERRLMAPDLDLEADPVRQVDRLFRSWAAASGSRVVAAQYRGVATRLAPARRAEPRLLDDLTQEARTLFQLGNSSRARAAAIDAYHQRRIALAEALARQLAPPGAEVL
ncbi:GntR family transcriptional regulator [Phenylobacterium sp.]|uniref:GntR family transcriptional regulator n=1 Tax=Phenylobacterium sp. TaxID=1871053 RepID=UPI0025F401C6|nr:GntR family transcriptional regulator [Phenylobacterium sp.]